MTDVLTASSLPVVLFFQIFLSTITLLTILFSINSVSDFCTWYAAATAQTRTAAEARRRDDGGRGRGGPRARDFRNLVDNFDFHDARTDNIPDTGQVSGCSGSQQSDTNFF